MDAMERSEAGAGEAVVLRAEGLRVRAGGAMLLDGVDLSVPRGRVLALVGPNGAGKTTLVRAVSGRLRGVSGRVWLGGRPLAKISPGERARRLAVLPQENPMPFALTVRDVVEMGRYPYLGRLGRPDGADRNAMEAAMERMRVAPLATRVYPTLSGGEKQRVLLARALAQEPDVLILDEPTANLDVNHALELLDLVRGLAHGEGLAVVVVEHTLAYARRFSDDVLALKGGRVFARGAPGEVLSPETVIRLFDISGEAARREVPSLV